MRVTIDRLRRRRDGMTEVLDGGETVCLLDDKALEASGLEEGSVWEWEELQQLSQQAQGRFAKSKALHLLARRDYSMDELAGKLTQWVSRDAAEWAVCRMQELGFVDDEKYACRLARDLMERRHFAPARAKRELVQKGVGRDVAARAVEAVEYCPEQSIGCIVRSKYGGAIEDERKLRRVFAALQRYGYGAYEIWPALRPFLEEDVPEE